MKESLKVIGGGLIVIVPFSLLYVIWKPSLLSLQILGTTLLSILVVRIIERFLEK
jgi:hypothetical protein